MALPEGLHVSERVHLGRRAVRATTAAALTRPPQRPPPCQNQPVVDDPTAETGRQNPTGETELTGNSTAPSALNARRSIAWKTAPTLEVWPGRTGLPFAFATDYVSAASGLGIRLENAIRQSNASSRIARYVTTLSCTMLRRLLPPHRPPRAPGSTQLVAGNARWRSESSRWMPSTKTELYSP